MDKIKSHFSNNVEDYDIVCDKVVFKNEELHKQLINAIPYSRDKELNILDLGSGTGHGMYLTASLFPKSKILGIDFSPRMINKSKEKLSEFSDRTDLLEMDFNEYAFDQKFDVIMSTVAIHNSTHSQKKELFRKIYDSLNDEGVFINADFYKNDSKYIENNIQNIYLEYVKENLSGDERKVWLKHATEEDKPMSLSQQYSILKELGFLEFKVIWLFNNEAVYIAHK